MIRLRGLNPVTVKFSIFDAIFWATCVSGSFIVVYLKSKGLSNTSIGTVLSINSLISIVMQPIWGIVSDRLQSIRKVFLACTIISGSIFLALPFVSWPLLICFLLSLRVFFACPLGTFVDTWIVHSIKSHPGVSYGSIRLWGSVAFAVVAMIFNFLIPVFSLNIIFPAFGILTAAMIFTSMSVKTEAAVKPIVFKDLKVSRLFGNYSYITLLIFAVLVLIPNHGCNTFMPDLIEAVGGRPEQLGLIISVKAIMELPAFISSRYLLNRFGHIKVLVAAGICYTLQVFSYSIVTRLDVLILIQFLHASAYALFITAITYYIYELAPDELKSTSQTIAACVYGGLTGVIGNYGGGIIIDSFGLRTMYGAGAAMSVLGLVVFLASFPLAGLFRKKQDLPAGDAAL